MTKKKTTKKQNNFTEYLDEIKVILEADLTDDEKWEEICIFVEDCTNSTKYENLSKVDFTPVEGEEDVYSDIMNSLTKDEENECYQKAKKAFLENNRLSEEEFDNAEGSTKIAYRSAIHDLFRQLARNETKNLMVENFKKGPFRIEEVEETDDQTEQENDVRRAYFQEQIDNIDYSLEQLEIELKVITEQKDVKNISSQFAFINNSRKQELTSERNLLIGKKQAYLRELNK